MDSNTWWRSLDRPGAVAADGPDAAVAEHFGDPLGEQRQAHAAAALVDRSQRDVLRLVGADRREFLQGLTSANFTGPGAGEGMLLDPLGHIEQTFSFLDDDESILLDLEPGQGVVLREFFTSMRFMLDVTIEPADWVVVSVIGPDASAAAGVDTNSLASLGAGYARRMPELADAGWVDLLLPRDSAAAALPAALATLPWAGFGAFEATRIAGGRARLGPDTDAKTLPNELGEIGRAALIDKGCYRGQETVARVYNLGHPPRRLTRLQLDGSVGHLPAVGDTVALADRSVGRMGSSRFHYELGPVGLALIKRTTPTDAELAIGDISAAQEIVVDPDVGLGLRFPELR